jgi:hypothetical protein
MGRSLAAQDIPALQMSVFWYFVAFSAYAEIFDAATCLENDCHFATIRVPRNVSGRASLFIVAISIIVGAVISLLASPEAIANKRRDEPVRKSDDQSWRV